MEVYRIVHLLYYFFVGNTVVAEEQVILGNFKLHMKQCQGEQYPYGNGLACKRISDI